MEITSFKLSFKKGGMSGQGVKITPIRVHWNSWCRRGRGSHQSAAGMLGKDKAIEEKLNWFITSVFNRDDLSEITH